MRSSTKRTEKKRFAPTQKLQKKAKENTIGVNAGHDLNLQNLNYMITHIPNVEEVSIGHALICDALYYGFQSTIPMYKRRVLEQNLYDSLFSF